MGLSIMVKGPYGLTILSRFTPKNGILLRGDPRKLGEALQTIAEAWGSFGEARGNLGKLWGAPNKLGVAPRRPKEVSADLNELFVALVGTYYKLPRSSPSLSAASQDFSEASPSFPKLPRAISDFFENPSIPFLGRNRDRILKAYGPLTKSHNSS